MLQWNTNSRGMSSPITNLIESSNLNIEDMGKDMTLERPCGLFTVGEINTKRIKQ